MAPWLHRRLCCLLLATWVGLSSNSAHAERPRDYMFAVPEDGTRAILEYFVTGMQLSLERTNSFYGKANTLRVRGVGLVSYPLAQAEVRADLRILFFEFGASAGYRSIWQALVFEPGKNGEHCSNCDRRARRKLNPILGAGPGTDRFPFVEARLQAHLPFNDYFVATGILATRFEGRKDRSYDWIFADIHDGGWAQRAEVTFFVKDRHWGGIGPYVQMLHLPKGGEHEWGWAVGFNALTRLGLVEQDDMLFVTFLIRPGDPLYGQHSYYMPVRALMAYRLMWSL